MDARLGQTVQAAFADSTESAWYGTGWLPKPVAIVPHGGGLVPATGSTAPSPEVLHCRSAVRPTAAPTSSAKYCDYFIGQIDHIDIRKG